MFATQPFVPTQPGHLALLRQALGDDAEILAQVQEVFAEGKIQGLCGTVDGQPVAFTGWRWKDTPPTYAQLMFLYARPDAADEGVMALTDVTLTTLRETADVIEVPSPVATPAFRTALQGQDVVFFERCTMLRSIAGDSLPDAALPEGYRLEIWGDQHQIQVEHVALAANQHTEIDAAAVPDATGERLVAILRNMRIGSYPGIDRWHAAASLVVLTPAGDVCGYIATVVSEEMGFVADTAVHPAHRRQGLARLLLTQSIAACQADGLTKMGLAVTTRNPARNLYASLEFETATCGDLGVWWRDGRQLPWRV
ncbi:MAG: GNAT family N-acetyltransferase [Anaerolineaceae bacterium]|nr:GNAT family N-acetyltransferase [Anaerolineaceae bacterium]